MYKRQVLEFLYASLFVFLLRCGEKAIEICLFCVNYQVYIPKLTVKHVGHLMQSIGVMLRNNITGSSEIIWSSYNENIMLTSRNLIHFDSQFYIFKGKNRIIQ